MKFQQKPDFLEFAVHLLQRGVREDQLELVLQWGKELLAWLSRCVCVSLWSRYTLHCGDSYFDLVGTNSLFHTRGNSVL